MTATSRPIVDPDGWVRARRSDSFRSWRKTDEGIIVRHRGEQSLWRSAYKPELSDQVIAEHGGAIFDAAAAWGLDPALIVATVVAESGGDPDVARNEPGLRDASFGVAQVLTSTARSLGERYGWPLAHRGMGDVSLRYAMPERSLPEGGDREEWREFLSDPWTSLNLCAARHDYSDVVHGCMLDPVFLYASYNAGAPYQADNAWGLRAANGGLAVDTFVRHYGCAVQAWRRAYIRPPI